MYDVTSIVTSHKGMSPPQLQPHTLFCDGGLHLDSDIMGHVTSIVTPYKATIPDDSVMVGSTLDPDIIGKSCSHL